MNHLKVTLLVAAAVFCFVPVVGCAEKTSTTVIDQPELTPEERAATDALEASY
ncbi:secreted protein [Rhodopirellula maiorica SM1]|uniref:Secreted protein n=1 Tax=Rhodopirellula maiorica SM1 TaxID=1265738 RepID=M5RFS7_9BACT|nr:hypothetical protein [Rhodopirellula maiorica]EMI17951.1 secreted protein [Rhodopirellula maiorica SM1]